MTESNERNHTSIQPESRDVIGNLSHVQQRAGSYKEQAAELKGIALALTRGRPIYEVTNRDLLTAGDYLREAKVLDLRAQGMAEAARIIAEGPDSVPPTYSKLPVPPSTQNE